MEISKDLENIFTSAMILADTYRNKLVTPEHLLLTTEIFAENDKRVTR